MLAARAALLRPLVALGFLAALSVASFAPAPLAPLPASVVHAQQTPAPDAQRQGGTVQQAYDLLMDRFVHPLDSAALLRAAWDQIGADAGQVKAPAPGQGPSLVGDRSQDIAAFRTSLAAYLGRQPTLPSGFVPAYSAIRGMITYAKEGHTYFMNPDQYREHLAWSRGDVKYGGIGARMKGPELVVVEVFSGSPAEQAGLRPGDQVIRVDDTSTEGLSVDQVVSLIRGPEGSWVRLTIQRPGEPDQIGVDVQRAEISYDFITSRMLDEQMGYIQLRGFTDPSVADQFETDVTALERQGARGLILDLRGNPGGRIDVGARVLSHFLPAGSTLYQQVERSGRREARSRRDSDSYALPMVVLVDSGTASMGEIFASAVQEYSVATVVGATTAGNVAAAQVYPLGDGSALQITVMEILSAHGNPLNGVGVEPNDRVDDQVADGAYGTDPVLDRARQILSAVVAPVPVSSSRWQAL